MGTRIGIAILIYSVLNEPAVLERVLGYIDNDKVEGMINQGSNRCSIAKPLTPQSPFKQITGIFKHEALIWIGAGGSYSVRRFQCHSGSGRLGKGTSQALV
jgi:hypothetical protein